MGTLERNPSHPDSVTGDWSDAHRDDDRDGFTALDDYLNWMAAPHGFIDVNDTLTVDGAELFRGFTDSPVYTVVAVSGGSAAVSGASITFTPAACGLAALSIRVTDENDSTMTRTVGIFVDSSPAGTCTLKQDENPPGP